MPSPSQRAWAWIRPSFSRLKRLSAKKICGLNGQWKLEQTRQTLEDQLQAIQVEKQQADEAAAKAKQELEEIRAERAEKIEQARLQAMQIVEQTRAESNALLEELDKLRKEKERATFSEDVHAFRT